MLNNILHDYAVRNGFDPKKLEDDYFSSKEKDQLALMNHIMQSGGENDNTTEDDNIQIVRLYAQKANIPVQELIAELQQMSPEQLQNAMEQMMNFIEESTQAPVSPEEINVAQLGYDDVSTLGYSDDSPYRENPYNLIQSNNITMDNTGLDLIGVSDTGDVQYMPAYSGDYEFNGNEVMEYPVYQRGKTILKTYDKFKKPFVAGSTVASPGFVPGKSEDSMFEDFVEIFDPTGVSSYDDIYREFQRYKNNQGSALSLGLEVLGGLPLIGKAGKIIKGGYKVAPHILKSLTKGSNYADVVGDAVSLASIAGNAIMQTAGTYYENLMKKPEVKELVSLRANSKLGYGNVKRLQELENKYGYNLDKAQKQFNKIEKKNSKISEVVYTQPKVEKSKFSKEELGEYNRLLAEEKRIAKAKAKAAADEIELDKLIQEENRIKEAKAKLDKSKPVKSQIKKEVIEPSLYGEPIPIVKRPDASVKGTIKGKRPLAIPDSELDKYGTKGIFYQDNLNPFKEPYLNLKESGKVIAKDVGKFIPGKSKLEKATALASGLGAMAYGIYDGVFSPENTSNTVPKTNDTNGVTRNWFADGSIFDNKDNSVVYNSGTTEPLKEVKPGIFQNAKGSTWIKDNNGKFVFQPNNSASVPLALTNPAKTTKSSYNSGSGRTNPYLPVTSDKDEWTGKWEKFLKGRGLMDGEETYSVDEIDDAVYDYVKNHPNEFNSSYLKDKNLSTLLTDGVYGKVHESFLPPTDDRKDFGNISSITPRGLSSINLETRFNKGTLVPKEIQYSPKIDGITPERPPAKSMYKFNTSSPFGDFIDNYNVVKSFDPIDLPYFEDVDYRAPDAPQYDPRPGLQAISDSFTPYKNIINSNSTTGQAVLASLASKEAGAVQKYMNSIEQQQTQADYQGEVNRADIYNKLVAGRNLARNNYVDNLYKTQANRDFIKDSTLAEIKKIEDNKLFNENAYNQMLAFNANIEDESTIWDKIIGRKKFSFDKDNAYKTNFA